ncbi:hypothetical protein LA76x_1602 [Lysobacter antibioticus]|uniref:Uncharacterized protein n=1 Tax=Lysobacter antibioticus TaxID=84531 RepID=A0A0S2F8I2_LYSAN|nr:hypothetical protein LA76x_1602 [Lysobacter antibioticus]
MRAHAGAPAVAAKRSEWAPGGCSPNGARPGPGDALLSARATSAGVFSRSIRAAGASSDPSSADPSSSDPSNAVDTKPDASACDVRPDSMKWRWRNRYISKRPGRSGPVAAIR